MDVVSVLLAVSMAAQPPLGSQAEAMEALSFMHGEWRGPATVYTQNGPQELTQTERVGPMLQGDVLAVEGAGYDETGALVFNAFAMISYDSASARYQIHSYASGRSGTFPLSVTENGYAWEIPAGPGARVRYEATFTPETWVQKGTYMRGDASFPSLSMTLTRIGDTDWPAGGAVDPN